MYMCIYHVTQWICSDSIKHRTLVQRVGAVAGFYVVFFPLWTYLLARWTVKRVVKGRERHRPELSPRIGPTTDELPIASNARQVAGAR